MMTTHVVNDFACMPTCHCAVSEIDWYMTNFDYRFVCVAVGSGPLKQTLSLSQSFCLNSDDGGGDVRNESPSVQESLMLILCSNWSQSTNGHHRRQLDIWSLSECIGIYDAFSNIQAISWSSHSTHLGNQTRPSVWNFTH